MLSKYKRTLKITDEMINSRASAAQRGDADAMIQGYDDFLKKLLLHYKELKKKTRALIEINNDKTEFNKLIIHSLSKYEERNFAYMSDSPEMQTVNKMILGGTNNDLVRGFQEMNELLRNPFQIIFYWIKSQVSDIKAMRETLVSRDNVIQMCHKIRSKKSQTKKEI